MLTNNEYNLYSPFDVEKHKKTFIDYFEAILMPDGSVQYAVPSHQEKLISIGKKLFGKSRNDFIAMCPTEKHDCYIEWLCDVTGCVALWNSFVVGKPNQLQMNKIRELVDAGIVYSRVLTILSGDKI